MQDFHVLTAVAQHVATKDIGVFHPLVFHQVCEALALNAGHVDDVGIGDCLACEVALFHEFHTAGSAIFLVLHRHLQLFRSDEMEGGRVFAHRHQQRMDRAAVFQVANHVDVQVVQSALGLVDGVEVQHRLGGVEVGAVAGIDDRSVGHLTRIQCGTFQAVAHHNHVSIVRHHLDCVLQCLALARTRGFGVRKTNHTGAEAVGGGLKT